MLEAWAVNLEFLDGNRPAFCGGKRIGGYGIAFLGCIRTTGGKETGNQECGERQ